MESEAIDGAVFREIIRNASDVLEENRSAVDALNVFPVPDGDTGTNMSLTMRAAVDQAGKNGSRSIGEVADAAAMGSLMGARGNSGVILSQIFRGIAKGLNGKDVATATDLAWAMQEGVATAYKAVMKPVEGTILTVAREASVAALTAAKQGGDVAEVWDAALERAKWILDRTPDMLPVLKQAGVVDAGGKGLVFILTGIVQALRGSAPEAARKAAPTGPRSVDFEITEEIGDIRFPYDTQLLVKGHGLDSAAIHERLVSLGDSLLVVGGGDVVRVHIHSANPGKVLECCLEFGALADISIENMRDQRDALKGAEPAARAADRVEPVLNVGIVAVSLGHGLTEIFKSLGANEVINGGQTMNPSTEDVLNAVERVPADKVILLPNNSNIILAAKQAKRLAGKKVYIVPTRTIPQGLSALLALKTDATVEINLKRMAKAIKQVKTGEVTYAVRKSSVNGVRIDPGDILGIQDGDIATTGTDPDEVLQALIEKMITPDSEIVTVFYGDLIESSRAEAVEQSLRERFPNLDVEFKSGGQPLYYYILSVE